MSFKKIILLCLCFMCSPCALGSVFVEWNDATLPPPSSLGVNQIVVAWERGSAAALLATARKQGYRAYVEAPLKQAASAAKACEETHCLGIFVNVLESQRAGANKEIAGLQASHPKLPVRVLSSGKQPKMRGSFVIKRDSVLEVSSPTAQPWIDTNLAFLRVEQRSDRPHVPLYTFSWSDQQSQTILTADDYSLTVAEAGAFHADLVLQLDDDLQQGLNKRDADAWVLWNQVRSIFKFSADAETKSLESAANVAVVVNELDPGDEVLNLLGRHNIPFQVFTTEDLKKDELKGFDIIVFLAKPDAESVERIKTLATNGATVVVVDAHGKYSWQSSQSIQINERTTSYPVGQGKVLEFAEPIPDPETFAQDIRRLLGKKNSLISLWNGLTTIAVPYKGRAGIALLELVNYAGEPVRLQVQVKGSFASIRYETPEHGCCQNLDPVRHDGFTEFVIPEINIAGRVHLAP